MRRLIAEGSRSFVVINQSELQRLAHATYQRIRLPASPLQALVRRRAAFYPRDDPCSNFHGPMSDGLILRALPPSLRVSGEGQGVKTHRPR